MAAAVTDGAFNALRCLRQANIRERSCVLVYGASGAIGTAGAQLAR
jgi:NADPH:quinone reductase-like Zn-dependent oxidoreductase